VGISSANFPGLGGLSVWRFPKRGRLVAGNAQEAVATSCKRWFSHGQHELHESWHGQVPKWTSTRHGPQKFCRGPIVHPACYQKPGLRRSTWTVGQVGHLLVRPLAGAHIMLSTPRVLERLMHSILRAMAKVMELLQFLCDTTSLEALLHQIHFKTDESRTFVLWDGTDCRHTASGKICDVPGDLVCK